jgi:uncharacterized protein (DUF2141 family)
MRFRFGVFARALGAACILLSCAHAESATTATLIVRVEKVSPAGGDLRVALYTEQSYPDDNADPVKDAVVPAKAPETTVTIAGLAPGVYAVKMFQDANRNGQFDMTWLGLPLEKYGFSNDARPIFTEPGFDRTKFTLPAGTTTITVHLQ